MVTRVNVNPVMIKWAREDAGLTFEDLPATLKNAEKWEKGELKPTWADLRNLARKYKRPSYFYFLSSPPKETVDFIEFRSDDKIEDFSPELRLEIRKAKSRRNAYIKIHEDMGLSFPNFGNKVSSEKNYIKLGKYIRNYLDVSFETQQKWIYNDNGNRDSSHNSFLNHWKEICFNLGILVFETKDVPESEMSGCSIYYDYCPIILLNGKNYHNRRIFTLMHELAHLIQGHSTICDIDKYNEKETFCNKVAAEILMPCDTFNDIPLFNKSNGKLKVAILSNIYGVSKQSIVYKLNDSNIISNESRDVWIKKLEEGNKIKREKDQKNKKNSSPHISTVIIKKKQDGTPYTRLILDAYDNEVITATQAMRYLDVSLDTIKSLDLDIKGE